MTRAHMHLVRMATLAAGLLPAIALAHPGHTEASSFAAGFMFTGAGLIAAAMAAMRAATKLRSRMPTAAAPRSPT